jgi:hypothetical protein
MDGIAVVILVGLCLSPDALAPRNYGDWNHDNSPIPTYRQNCHPAMSICQLPRRGITKKESDINKRALSGDQVGTPTRPIIPEEDHPFGPDIAKGSSPENLSLRSGPAIKYCSPSQSVLSP